MSEYLYLIRCREAHKIGVAADVRSRIASLQTGNPYKLELVECFQFPNAELVEKALHQRFAEYRTLGEWFEIPNAMIGLFGQICEMLGGVRIAVKNGITEEEIEGAEEIQEAALDRRINGDEWDYAAMFADGWRMNVQDSRRLYWNWRRGSDENRQTIYGGVVADLPYPIEDMRRIYRDGVKL